MTEDQIAEEIDTDPFRPVRLHAVSGKTIDLLRPFSAMPLRDRLLVFRNLARDGRRAEGYDIVAYHSIERIEQLDIGKRLGRKGKTA
jgi:hypothetical protein